MGELTQARMQTAGQPVLIGRDLSLAALVRVAREGERVGLAPEALPQIRASRAYVEEAVRTALDPTAPLALKQARSIYGVTTGFGGLKHCSVATEAEARELQLNLLRSTACGAGPPLPTDVVRAVLLLRAQTLAAGRSGVRPELIERILELLNRRIHPLVPEQGSLGSSGDLCPLAHLALVLLGRGQAEYDGAVSDGAEALKRAGLEPDGFELSYKEGLALINGTPVMTALLALALVDARELLVAADIVGAMSAEALGARWRAFDPRLHRVRRQPGQIRSAENLRRLWRGSTLMDAGHEVQDSYSIRCMPVVHGASRDALEFAGGVVERELNAVTDNPLVFVADGEPVLDGRVEDRSFSGANFHGQPLALAADLLAIAVAELADIAERRAAKLLDPSQNGGLPAMLSPHPGLHSGLMIAQYTAAALVSENKILCHPASVDSIPTSANAEDHNSMGMTAALKLRRVVENTAHALSAELLCAAQALDLRTGVTASAAAWPGRKAGTGTSAAWALARQRIAPLVEDRELADDLRAGRDLILSGALRRPVEAAVGTLA